MWEVRPRGDYVQDERYVASEHMDVRRDCVIVAPCLRKIAAGRASHMKHKHIILFRTNLCNLWKIISSVLVLQVFPGFKCFGANQLSDGG